MSFSQQLDTLALVSIQHELAMNAGLSQQLIPMLRHIMKVCLRRLSVRRVTIFHRHDDEYTPPDEMHTGPAQSFYYYMPLGANNEILQVTELNAWLERFFQMSSSQSQPELFEDNGLYYHTYPLGESAAIILERKHSPLPCELVNALVPVFERLRGDCQVAIQHERVVLEIERRRTAEKKIEYLAYHDDLTNLPNRRELLSRIAGVIAHDNKNQCALLYIGLNNFRDINDSLGYVFGDALLIEIARQLSILQDSSIHLARIGGDEFGLLYRNIAKTSGAASCMAINMAHTLQTMLEKPLVIKGRSITVAASIGIVTFGDKYIRADTIISMGSTALRKAKVQGNNTLQLFNKSMTKEIDQRLTLDTEMRLALKQNQFLLYLQPQVDQQGRFIGAETLIRWVHPEKGVISPANFIPVAEKSGFIVPLSDWVLVTACEMIKRLEEEGVITSSNYLAVNLSAKQFYQADFVNRVISILETTGVKPGNLELELTESTLIVDAEETIEKMKQLRELGIRFSIDDFGTGYSSLAYLKRLPVDRIKIDRAFVMNVDTSQDDAAIVNIIISMAKHFDLNVIAEGVETQSECKALMDMGCGEFQGYLFHHPMPFEELIKQKTLFRHDSLQTRNASR